MKKTIAIAALGILMLAGVMAMYSGESTSFETNLTNPVYTVTGNTSTLEGLTVEFENGNITIISDPLMASDTFTMLFFDNITHEVVRTIHSGGGSSSTRYVDKNVTTYVPEYINNTIEVEKTVEVDNPITIEEGFSIWKLLFMGFVCLAFGLWVGYDWREKSDNRKTD